VKENRIHLRDGVIFPPRVGRQDHLLPGSGAYRLSSFTSAKWHVRSNLPIHVIIDRISTTFLSFSGYLKNAALSGSIILTILLVER